MIIVYKSNTGYTEQYAKLLGDALDMPSYSLDNVPKCHRGGEVIFLGWLFAGNIVGYKKAAKLYKVRCACGVGMGPPTPELVPGFRAKMGIPQSTAVFYLQGGFDINKLKGPMKLIMKVKCKEIARSDERPRRAQPRGAGHPAHDGRPRLLRQPREPGRGHRLVQVNIRPQAAALLGGGFLRPGGIFYNCDASLMQIGYKPVVSWRKTGRERQKWGKPSEFSRCAWPFSCCSRAAGRSRRQ